MKCSPVSLKDGVRSEKCTIRRFHPVNVAKGTYTNLGCTAHYTLRLYGVVYCS